MTKPYLLMADLHCHAWSQFATTKADGMNSRLDIILNEADRAIATLHASGGSRVVLAGDLFHVRGSIVPEVFNPTHALIKRYADRGIEFVALPGNHDLAGKETDELGNAIQTLGALPRFKVVNDWWEISEDGHRIITLCWQSTPDRLRTKVAEIQDELKKDRADISNFDLVIHAGIDGVLTGVPEHGLTASEIAGWGFKRVFAGHYHNHKVMENGKVVSIGALTHQTWGDIGSKAGFLLVYPDRIEYSASHAPNFVELTEDDDPTEYPLIVDRNYVRVRGMKLTDAEINTLRKELLDMGALGVTFQVARQVVTAHTNGEVAKATTLGESVAKYIDGLELEDKAPLKAVCADILATAQAIPE